MSETAKIELDGKVYELPVIVGSENEKAIDISKLRDLTGYITLDTGYKNTGATKSAITYLDGEEGILHYRGYSIEELAEKAKDPYYKMDRSQFSRYLGWKKNEDKGILDDIGLLSEGVAHIFEQIAKTAGSVADHPLQSLAKLGPSGVEAFYQGTRNMYGMLAQSSNPTSKFF